MADRETDDPRAALGARDTKTRAAGARDLGRYGSWDDLPALVERALHDKSSAIRLYAAAAASDILARHRGAAGQERLTPEQVVQVHRWASAQDPGTNPGLLMLWSAVADERALERLGRILRDPRNGVRMGALAAVRRMALSAAAVGDEAIERAVGEWLVHPKIPPDVVLELVRLVGEAGWSGLRRRIEEAAGSGRLQAEATQEALKRLEERADPASWAGLWISDGRDVLEVTPDTRPPQVLVVGAAEVFDEGGRLGALRLEEGRAWVGEERWRLICAPRLGAPDERQAALQGGGRTFWRQEDKALHLAVEEHVDALGPEQAPALRALADRLEGDETMAGRRSRALLRWRAGDKEAAAALLEAIAADRKPRVDTWWWLGRVQADAGQTDAAAASLATYLEKAPRRAPFRARAEALHEELRG